MGEKESKTYTTCMNERKIETKEKKREEKVKEQENTF